MKNLRGQNPATRLSGISLPLPQSERGDFPGPVLLSTPVGYREVWEGLKKSEIKSENYNHNKINAFFLKTVWN